MFGLYQVIRYNGATVYILCVYECSLWSRSSPTQYAKEQEASLDSSRRLTNVDTNSYLHNRIPVNIDGRRRVGHCHIRSSRNTLRPISGSLNGAFTSSSSSHPRHNNTHENCKCDDGVRWWSTRERKSPYCDTAFHITHRNPVKTNHSEKAKNLLKAGFVLSGKL